LVIWYILPVFGLLYREKSGNPVISSNFEDSIKPNKVCTGHHYLSSRQISGLKVSKSAHFLQEKGCRQADKVVGTDT
jgi:hypothetical protein